MSKLKVRVTKEHIAVGLAIHHPELSDKEIAAAVPCSRTSLYRMASFRKVRLAAKKIGKDDMPRGSKGRDKGTGQVRAVEAWLDKDDDDDDDDDDQDQDGE